MTKPPSVFFGPSGRTDRWWALLPTSTALHAPNASALISDVERAMARDKPGRPFALVLDLYGSREPGAPGSTPDAGSAAHRLTVQRRPEGVD